MRNKSRLNWSLEQDKMLKILREEQNIIQWKIISQKLKDNFLTNRSAKQCRQRYINTAKYSNSNNQRIQWSQKQDNLLGELYLRHNSKWTLFTNYFPKKSQNTIKNRFYSCLRKNTRKLNQLIQISTLTRKGSLKVDMLLTILELANKIETQSEFLVGYKVQENMELLKVRNSIIKFCFSLNKASQIQQVQLVNSIHKLNCSLKYLGIFKMKNKKMWKLDQKKLNFVFSRDQKVETVTQLNRVEENTSKNEIQSHEAQSSLFQYLIEQHKENLELNQISLQMHQIEPPQIQYSFFAQDLQLNFQNDVLF